MVYTIYHPSSRRAHGALRCWWSVCGRQPPRSVVSFKLPINSSSAREQKFNTALVKPYPRCLVVLKLLFAFFFSSGDLRKKIAVFFSRFTTKSFPTWLDSYFLLLCRLNWIPSKEETKFFYYYSFCKTSFQGNQKVLLIHAYPCKFIKSRLHSWKSTCFLGRP